MRTCTATLLLFYCNQTSLVYVRHKGDPATSPRKGTREHGRGKLRQAKFPHTRLSTSLRRRYAHSPARRPLGHKVPQGWQAPGGSFYGSTIDKKKGRPGIGRRRGKHLRSPPTACRRERGAGSVFPSLESARFSVGVWESARFSVGVSESARFSVGVWESARESARFCGSFGRMQNSHVIITQLRQLVHIRIIV